MITNVTHRLLPLVAVCLLAGCVSPTETDSSAWQATLVPVPPSAVTGTAAALSRAGRTVASLGIRRGTAGSHGWRMVLGTCASPGSTLGGAALYPTMSVGPGGTAEAEASVPGELSPGASYAVQVFVAEATGERIEACGDLARTS